MHYAGSNLASPELTRETFLGICLLPIVKIFVLLLLCWVQFIIPHFSFVRTSWHVLHQPSWGSAKGMTLTAIFSKARQLKQGSLSPFHPALLCI